MFLIFWKDEAISEKKIAKWVECDPALKDRIRAEVTFYPSI